MGMDVVGANPKNQEGEYFRANVWSWHPIWDYCYGLVPEICSKVEHAHSNDGDGLNEDDARIVGEAVLISISNGSAKKFILEREAFMNAIPDTPCIHCYATGLRQWHKNTQTGKLENKWKYNLMQEPVTVDELEPRTARTICENEIEIEEKCNGCDGTGFKRPWATHYGFDLEHLEEFGKFLVASGGFNIW
ncbi:MAG: hypothetical protein ACO3CH_00115 [Ilumatobacteraceae bacterium]